MSSPSDAIPPGLVPVVPYSALAHMQGALFIGVVISVFLFGISTTQSWYYYQHYPNDRKFLKAVVATLWLFELFHAVLACHAVYWYLVMNYSNPEALGVSIWSANLTLLASAFITLIVHLFFAWRVRMLSGGRWLIPVIIGIVALASSAFVLATVGLSFKAGTFADYPEPDIEVVSSTSLALSVLADIMIAVSIGYYLNRGRSGFSKTDHLINKLIFYAMNVGILTSVLDFVVLITSEVDNSLIFLAIFEVVGSVYFNSLLAMLNIRHITRGQVLNEDGTSLELHSTNHKTTVEFKAGTDGSQSGIETPKKRSRTTLFGGRSMQSKTMIHTEVHEFSGSSHDHISEFEAAPSTEHQVAREIREIV
ncbi:hypothetical protein BDZ89DRAFT_1059540 [Hymenopellis radicata]|nr:hypothetical protein BDZ89DRAFT_1059540 [Hymenopellis radicata]